MKKGKWRERVGNREGRGESEEQRKGNRKWKMENDEWRMDNGKRK